MRRTTVLLADDHPVVLDGLSSLLKEDYDVVGRVVNGETLLEAAVRLRPDVIVTDLSMPLLSGLEVLGRLRAARIESRVIVLTMHSDPELATEAMQAGASGFVLKDAAGEELLTAIREVLQGHVYLAPAVTKDVMSRLSASAATAPKPQLTPRQRDVLRLIVEGRRMKEIAAALQLSTRTVETHKYAMMEALGVHSTAELVRYAIQHRIAE